MLIFGFLYVKLPTRAIILGRVMFFIDRFSVGESWWEEIAVCYFEFDVDMILVYEMILRIKNVAILLKKFELSLICTSLLTLALCYKFRV